VKLARLATGCLALLVMWGGLSALALRLMTPATPATLRPWLALAAGLLLALGLQSFYYLARGVGRGTGSRKEILRRAATGELPEDGGVIVASGVVRALGPTLRSPLSGVECVAYLYRMYYRGRRSGQKRALVDVPVYWGHAARPFAIDAPSARFRVLAVPLLGDYARRHAGAAVIEQARQFVAATRFEDVSLGALGVAGTALQLARTIFTDEDGEARRDLRAADDLRDPETLILEETVLPVGETASVSGRWSAERAAIVVGDELGASVSAALGPPENLRRGPSEVPHSFGSYLMSAIVLTALGAGLVWFSIAVLPGLR
jgi:hypothetical protein